MTFVTRCKKHPKYLAIRDSKCAECHKLFKALNPYKSLTGAKNLVELNRKSLRKMLDQIDHFLAYNREGAALWRILSALRGPDIEDEDTVDIKDRATVPIRAAAFPLVLAKARNHDYVGLGAVFTSTWADKNPRTVEVDPANREIEHFFTHAAMAADVLGLKSLYTVKGLNEPLDRVVP